MLTFFDTEFLLAHGRRPSGRGYWAFAFGGGSLPGKTAPWFAPGDLAYGAAKKLAAAEAKRRGATVVFVCP